MSQRPDRGERAYLNIKSGIAVNDADVGDNRALELLSVGILRSIGVLRSSVCVNARNGTGHYSLVANVGRMLSRSRTLTFGTPSA